MKKRQYTDKEMEIICQKVKTIFTGNIMRSAMIFIIPVFHSITHFRNTQPIIQHHIYKTNFSGILLNCY